MKNFYSTEIKRFNLENGTPINSIKLSYQIFGQPIGLAPIIVVNHSLTGNSNCGGNTGWWKEIIGNSKAIDTLIYTIISFNIPGNEFEDEHWNPNQNYRKFTIRDIAALYWEGLFSIKINTVFAVIGGELGGAIAWEMAALQPNRIEHLIPIATDWKTSDRVIATSQIQEQLLNNSEDPLVDARYYANIYFKNPDYVNQLFKRNNIDTNSIEGIESVIIENNRDKIASYRLMNHLLNSNDICRKRVDFKLIIKTIKGTIHSIGIDSESLFPILENRKTAIEMKKIKSNTFYQEFKSIHSQDAYIKEFETIATLLSPIFNSKTVNVQNQFKYNVSKYSMLS